MLYQFDDPYIMSDEKFMNKFTDFNKTSYQDGLEAMVTSFKNGSTKKNNL